MLDRKVAPGKAKEATYAKEPEVGKAPYDVGVIPRWSKEKQQCSTGQSEDSTEDCSVNELHVHSTLRTRQNKGVDRRPCVFSQVNLA